MYMYRCKNSRNIYAREPQIKSRFISAFYSIADLHNLSTL